MTGKPRQRQPSIGVALLVLLLLVVQGCSNEYAEDIQARYQAVDQRLQTLGQQIDAGQIANALLIKAYAGQLSEQQPELREVAQLLARDATTQGAMYQGLLQRLQRVNQVPENKYEYAPALQELESLWAASDPVVYNDALMDVVNTLADLSDGALARINIPKDAAAAAVDGGVMPGSYLVGNPNYGQWVDDGAGNSFWQWYGQFRLLTDVFTGFGGGYYRTSPVYYDDWYRRPRYSYHHDYGRKTYGSYADRSTWQRGSRTLAERGIKAPTPKHYGSVAGQKRVSTYNSMRSQMTTRLRSGQSGVVGAGTSSAGVKRTSSFFGSSSRGTSAGSRSSFGGK